MAAKALPAECQLLGDDLFATHVDRVREGSSAVRANAVLVKPNQAGTVSRARTRPADRATGRARHRGQRAVR